MTTVQKFSWGIGVVVHPGVGGRLCRNLRRWVPMLVVFAAGLHSFSWAADPNKRNASYMRKRSQLLRTLWLLAFSGCGDAPNTMLSPLGTGQEHSGLSNQTVSAAETDITPSVGYGWDRTAKRFTIKCVTGEVKKADSAREGRLNIKQVMETSEAIDKLGFGAGAKAHFNMYSGSMRAQAARALSAGKHSYVWAFSSEYSVDGDELDVDKEITLTLPGKVGDTQGKWNEICGDDVVNQIKRGAMFLVVYRLDFDSLESKKELEAALGGKAGDLAEVNANLKAFKSMLNNHAVLSVEAYQFGGDPTLMTGMFSRANATGEEELAAAKAIVKCSASDLESCDRFLKNAVLYGTSRSDPNAFPQQAARAPSPVGYGLTPWVGLGKGISRNLAHDTLETNRRNLASLFDQAVSDKRRLELMLREHWVQGPDVDAIDELRSRLARYIGEVTDAVGACYDDVQVVTEDNTPRYTPESLQRCANLVGRLEERRVFVQEGIGRSKGEKALLGYWREFNGAGGEDPSLHPRTIGKTTCGRTSGVVLCVAEQLDGLVAKLEFTIGAYERYVQPGTLERLGLPTQSAVRDKMGFGTVNRFERGVLYTGPRGTFMMGADLYDAWQALDDEFLRHRVQYPIQDEAAPTEGQNFGAAIWRIPGTRVVFMHPDKPWSYIGCFQNWSSVYPEGTWNIVAEGADGYPTWRYQTGTGYALRPWQNNVSSFDWAPAWSHQCSPSLN